MCIRDSVGPDQRGRPGKLDRLGRGRVDGGIRPIRRLSVLERIHRKGNGGDIDAKECVVTRGHRGRRAGHVGSVVDELLGHAVDARILVGLVGIDLEPAVEPQVLGGLVRHRGIQVLGGVMEVFICLLYTSPHPFRPEIAVAPDFHGPVGTTEIR